MTNPTHSYRRSDRIALVAAVGLLLPMVTACGGASPDSAAGSTDRGPASKLRLGFFANITHATAFVGVREGFFTRRLGSTKLQTQILNAGPAAIEAIFGGALDATYIGPSPSINAYVQSNGKAIRIIAGAASGGAGLVVRPEINSAENLRGKKIATPQLGNTQDVALRAWLSEHGLKTSKTGQGDVTIQAGTENAATLQLFMAGKIDGAWLPEPWMTRLVQEAGAKVLVDEKTLWPAGKFVTTQLIVATKFLDEHPETVRQLLEAHVDATQWINQHPDQAKQDVNTQLGELTGKRLPDSVIDAAWRNIDITVDPVSNSLVAATDHAVEAGLIHEPHLKGIYDLRMLNEILAERRLRAVSDGGLGSTSGEAR